jgi:hypothetical protein
MNFPTWMFHAEQGAKLFNTKEEFKKAGKGWFDHPEKCNGKAKQEEPEEAEEQAEEVPAEQSNEEPASE